MKRICDYKIFGNYFNREYKVVTIHKIFGEKIMSIVINGFVDDAERAGIKTHSGEMWCNKNDDKFEIVENNDGISISDSMLKIFVNF